jgi:beta-glucosidase
VLEHTGAMTSTADDVGGLVARLDLPTKVRLLTGATAFTLHGEPSIGLHEMAFSDGPTGVRGLRFTGGEAVALFPNATLLSAAWDEDAAREMGEALAEEAERQRIHVVLGPTINLHRTALGGRLFEAYSEDPLLTGRIAAAYVRGLQGRGVAACLKHLVANESETLRNYVDSVVSERALREVYLLPFEIALDEGGAWSVMAAYNDVNGTTATEQVHVNTEVVKGEWGWDGLLMSDWYATKSAGPAANGGLDLVMPGPDGPWGDALLAAVRAGEVAEDVVDDHVARLLRLAARVGALAGDGRPARAWPATSPAPTDPARRAQLRRLATDGMVVLRNEGGVLPLDASASVALVGRLALETTCMGGGSAQVNPPHQVPVADGLREALGGPLVVVDGVPVRDRPLPAAPDALTDPVTGEPGARVTYLDADGAEMRTEHVAAAAVGVGFDDDLPRPVAGPGRCASAPSAPDGGRCPSTARSCTRSSSSPRGTTRARRCCGRRCRRPTSSWPTAPRSRPACRSWPPSRGRDRTAASASSTTSRRPAWVSRRSWRPRCRPRPARCSTPPRQRPPPPTWPSSWSASPRSRRPRPSTRPRWRCPASRTHWSRRWRARRPAPWWWSTPRRPS